ncbi:MAG: hypothetical protein OXF01_02895 [Gemmatimonadetes bacterium]|nr:hypothetical protein [Gemmatimonadota bacterium]
MLVRNSRPLRWVAMVTSLSGCAEDSASRSAPTGVTVTDSADIRILEVGGEVLDTLPEWSLSDDTAVTMGVNTGDDPYLFGLIAGAIRLPSGEIVIVDEHGLEFRVFGPDGVFRRAFGREGEGPGEFRRVVFMRKLGDGGFAVFDSSLNRLTFFDDHAVLVESRSSACSSVLTQALRGRGALRCYFDGLVGDGTSFWYGPQEPDEPEPAPRHNVVRRYPGKTHILALEVDDGIELIDSGSARSWARISRTVGGMLAVWGVPELFSPHGHRAFGPHGLALAESERWEVRFRDSSGVLKRILRVRKEPEIVTRAHIDAIVGAVGTPASLSPADLALQYLNTVPTGGRVPFFSELRFDDSGRLWIADYVPSPILVNTEELRWTILDENAFPLARMTTGPSDDILEIGDDYMLLRERDEMDVERVAMYRIERFMKEMR